MSASPADEVVRLAFGLATALTAAQFDKINRRDVNSFSVVSDRGIRLWDVRTLSSDPESKYVNLRRLLAYIEGSIESGCRWVVFEPNGERLRAAVRQMIDNFLHSEWRRSGLLDERPERASFVSCDRTTVIEDDINTGRPVCLVGVKPVKPDEFVVVCIGLQTADRTD